MPAEIKTFPGVEFVDQGPNEQPQQEVIELIERLLELAESGELQALAVVGVLSDGTNLTDYSTGNGPYRHMMIAAVTELQFRMLQDIHAPEENDDEKTG
jgi:hypothetical protein